MTDTQKHIVQEKIFLELGKISKDITVLQDAVQPFGYEDMDEITRMDALASKSVNEAALVSARSRLAALEYALKRIQEPEFGYCLDCGEQIPFTRLLALPGTPYCVDCAK